MDRIDLQVRVESVAFKDINTTEKMESSGEIKERVDMAVSRQRSRYKNEKIDFNSQLHGAEIKKYCKLGKSEESLLGDIYDKFNLSVRTYEKILKVARTIADLDMCEKVKEKHLMMAIGYKMGER